MKQELWISLSKKEQGIIMCWKLAEYMDEWQALIEKADAWRPPFWRFFLQMYWLRKCRECTARHEAFNDFVSNP